VTAVISDSSGTKYGVVMKTARLAAWIRLVKSLRLLSLS
jgi:hypothetical protein